MGPLGIYHVVKMNGRHVNILMNWSQADFFSVRHSMVCVG